MKVELVGDVFDRLDVADAIKNATEDVDLLINTEGGSVFEGLQIVNAIKNSEHQVHADVQVMACSIGAVIALACDSVTIDKNSLLMCHCCWTFAVGNKKDLQEEVNAMETIDTILKNIISEHCKDDSIIERMEDGDVWLTGEQVADLFDNATLVERVKPTALVAKGSLADIINKYNAMVIELDALKAEKEEKEDPKEEPKQDPETEDEPEEEKEDKQDVNEDEPEYVVTDELKNLLAMVDKLGD